MSASDLAPTRDTPSVAADFTGVRIALSPDSPMRGPLSLVGVFQVSKADADAIDTDPHRALIVVIASIQGTITGAPFRERVFFADDVQRVGALVRGYFSVELVDPDDPIPEGPNWATVSLGVHLSNVVGFAGPQAPEQT